MGNLETLHCLIWYRIGSGRWAIKGGAHHTIPTPTPRIAGPPTAAAWIVDAGIHHAGPLLGVESSLEEWAMEECGMIPEPSV